MRTSPDEELANGEPDEEELADSTDRTGYELVPLDASLLKNVAVIRAIAAILIGLAVLAWPDRTNTILSRLVGVAFVWLSVTSLWAAIRQRRLQWASTLVAIAGVAVGVFLLASPDRSASFLGRLLGVALLAEAIRRIIDRDPESPRRTTFAPVGALIAAGALMLAFPEDLLTGAAMVASLGWICLSLVVVIVSLDARTAGTTSYSGAFELTWKWLNDRPKSVEARQALYAKILYEGEVARQKVIRFFVLMGFAVLIASMGC